MANPKLTARDIDTIHAAFEDNYFNNAAADAFPMVIETSIGSVDVYEDGDVIASVFDKRHPRGPRKVRKSVGNANYDSAYYAKLAASRKAIADVLAR